jgi:hypothetical protein
LPILIKHNNKHYNYRPDTLYVGYSNNHGYRFGLDMPPAQRAELTSKNNVPIKSYTVWKALSTAAAWKPPF